MSEIKLQVGKIYRNRKGEEVRIIGKNNKCPYPYHGDNDYRYKENGKWDNSCTGHPEDLVAEVTISDANQNTTAKNRTFAIPDGMKIVTVEQIGDRIIIKMMPEKEPKPGDVMINNWGSIYIFKAFIGDYNHKYYVWLGKNGHLAFESSESSCPPGHLATPEEAQPLFDALKKAGKRWNPQTMQVEDIKPKPGDVMVNDRGSVYIFKSVVDDDNHEHYAWLGEDDLWVEIGMYCTPGRPATPEEAQLLFDALKKAGKKWNPETMEVEDVPEIDHIREWVEKHLDYRYYNHESLTKVIYNYLKYKDGKK